GFVNDVIAEAQAQQSAPTARMAPSAAASAPAKSEFPPASHETAAPDDFGAEPEATFADAPATDMAGDGAWTAGGDVPPDGIDHRGPIAPPEPVHDAPSIVPPAAPSPARRPTPASIDVDDGDDYAA